MLAGSGQGVFAFGAVKSRVIINKSRKREDKGAGRRAGRHADSLEASNMRNHEESGQIMRNTESQAEKRGGSDNT